MIVDIDATAVIRIDIQRVAQLPQILPESMAIAAMGGTVTWTVLASSEKSVPETHGRQ
jgi:hypothetical protein